MPPAIVGEGERGPREEERWSGAVVDEGEEPREEERRGVALVGEREREGGVGERVQWKGWRSCWGRRGAPRSMGRERRGAGRVGGEARVKCCLYMSLVERRRWAFCGLRARPLFSEADFIMCPPPKLIYGGGQLKITASKIDYFLKLVVLN